MGNGLDFFNGRLVDLGFAATVLLGVVALAMLSSRQPARRLRIARLGLIGALSLPLLDRIQTLPRFDLGPDAAEAFVHFFEWAAPGLLGRLAAIPRAVTDHRRDGIEAMLVGLYLVGVAIGLAWMGLGWLGARWLLSRSRPPNEGLVQLYGSIPYSRGDRPELLVSERARRPMLLGVFRPKILIPTALDDPESPHAPAVLVHELAHSETSDPLFGLLAEFLMIVGYPIPPLWWIRRQARLDQEFAADAHAARMLGDPGGYASSLVSIAGTTLGGAGLVRSAVGGETREGSYIYRRVLLLLRPRFEVELRPPILWLSYCTAILFGITLAVATTNVRPSWRRSSPSRGSAPSEALRIANLTLPPGGATSLPIPGAGEFSLEGEIVCSGDVLCRVRVMGLSLRPAAGPPDPAEKARRFRAEVAEGEIRLTVEGRLVATRSRSSPFRSPPFASDAEVAVTFSELRVDRGLRPPK